LYNLQPTGNLIRRGQTLEEDVQNLKKLITTFKSKVPLPQNAPEKRQLTELFKNILGTFLILVIYLLVSFLNFILSLVSSEALWQFYCGYESVVLNDIIEQSKVVKGILDTISEVIEENSSFETNYRRFTHETIKVNFHIITHIHTHAIKF
jgi:hypothetical protein